MVPTSAAGPFVEPIATDRFTIRLAQREGLPAVVAMWIDPSFRQMLPNKDLDGTRD